MKISGSKLTKAMNQAGVTADQLGSALAQPGFSADEAAAAIRNWMRNNDHPRCKAGHIARLSQSLGVAPKDIAIFTSMVRGHRGSARKARLIADLIRGKSVDTALNLLSFNTRRAAVNFKKCLAAAVADAQLGEADEGSLIVCESRVDEGLVMKRFQPKDRGRAHPILKKSSHITVSVEERSTRN